MAQAHVMRKWLMALLLFLSMWVTDLPVRAAFEEPIKLLSPTNGQTLESFLGTIIRWQYPQRPRSAAPFPFMTVNLQVADNPEFKNPIVDKNFADDENSYPAVLLPETKYFIRLTPIETGAVVKYYTNLRGEASFSTSPVRNRYNAPDSERYKNPRVGAHWQYLEPVKPMAFEPLSPWFDVKAYNSPAPPTFAEIKGRFPVPVWDGHADALAAWNYCWETLFRVWIFAPHAVDHQAVATLLGYPTWGPWGSTMVFDSCFILHFSRYGSQAWPFITCLDNCYARQHENGFICRESDRENREVYATFPVNPPLFAWAEWEWFKISNDKERLRRVLTALVKHYEWYMTYQRRQNGLYWIDGVNEADDSPRNTLMYYAVSASSYQALAAEYLARIAHEAGRDDLKHFFDSQRDELGWMVNEKMWDAQHHLYNDQTRDGKFITELQPGVLCKHLHMFWPLMADIVPEDRKMYLIDELKNPASFNRASGFASLSADSAGYNKESGQYWRGAVWPSAQCMVQEGLQTAGSEEFLQDSAIKYYRACLTAFSAQKTIRENLSPDAPVGCGAADFVGWGGVGPVANLIEFVLGFDIDAPARTITWRIRQPERHGLQNLMFDGFNVDLVCDTNRQVTVTSGGAFSLKIISSGKTVMHDIKAGTEIFSVP